MNAQFQLLAKDKLGNKIIDIDITIPTWIIYLGITLCTIFLSLDIFASIVKLYR